MTLLPDTRIGPYEVRAVLGAGGMGEVYRARDTKLGRDVALKVLPDLLTNDPERVARFQREAQVLASLNHPNIAHIYGFEDGPARAGGPAVHAIVMELVEGPTLADRMAGGALPWEDALPIARQIADALEAAHEQGIIHRDLKPANVKASADGTVKVLDFGLAKALGPDATGASGDASNSPTLTARGTQIGMILGTAAYMAPEQARGRAVDRRADIWAFGVVLYEMLAGKRAFEGEDISITLASVLKEDVDWQALPPDLPAPLRRLLRRCLEKDPKRRLSAIGDARLELEDVSAGPAQDASAASAAAAQAIADLRKRATRGWIAAAGLAVIAALVAVVAWMNVSPPADAPALVQRAQFQITAGGVAGRHADRVRGQIRGGREHDSRAAARWTADACARRNRCRRFVKPVLDRRQQGDRVRRGRSRVPGGRRRRHAPAALQHECVRRGHLAAIRRDSDGAVRRRQRPAVPGARAGW
jgi:eukaryotic-like serine/threonine-protein kinase